MKKIMAAGTFDILHKGHIEYLSQAKKLGDYLIVVVATDKNVERIKGREPVHKQEDRRKSVSEVENVDEAVIGNEKDMINMVEKIKPKIIAMGYDQKPTNIELMEKFKERGLKTKIVRIPAHKPETYKSSLLRKKYENEGEKNGHKS